MEWYDGLYVGKNIQSNKKSVIRKIKRHKFVPGVYVLTLPANEQNVLDIYPSYVLTQKYYQKQSLYVVGIAKGMSEAKDVMCQLVMEALSNTGSCKVAGLVQNNKE